MLLKFIRPAEKALPIQKVIGLLTRLPLGFSHLTDYKFQHGFLDALNALCSESNDTESTYYYIHPQVLLCCHQVNIVLGNYISCVLHESSI